MEYWRLIRSKLGSQRVILPAAAGAIQQDKKVLLVMPRDGSEWQFPGGVQDLGESITETAEREIHEELDLQLHAAELISVFTSPRWNLELANGDRLQSFLLFFRMEGDFVSSQIHVDGEEIEDFRFFDLKNPPRNIKPCCKQKCIDLSQYSGGVFFH